MMPFVPFTSRVIVLLHDDIDTDQIIPARFLKGTAKTGLGAHLFADWNIAPNTGDSDIRNADNHILLVGRNFGCGSSREHAVWALVDRGFCAIIARSFADIFRANAAKNGLVTIELGEEAWAKCRDAETLTIDLDAVTLPDGSRLAFSLEPFAKHCLATGLDELGYILSFADRIAEFENTR